MINGATFHDVQDVTPSDGRLARAINRLRVLLTPRPAPAASSETEVDILLEDTIHGVTVRFTGKDEA